ncbi:uncharacterized protein LOC122502176 [Leptopilina heterotoma]|uniref:uncharacterized protein LOC122502176 n=1 Tax=Leptopilina heterotoma TaxID=63436 RepID=UPI001CA98B33|nr:uncharacterized protein LOC122502176 [Leptopilina heterotoma]
MLKFSNYVPYYFIVGDNGENIENDDSVYRLISFVGFTDESGRKLVDVVLSSWIRYNFKSKQYLSKFPPPPYDASCRRNLNKLLKSLSEAPEVWPEYPINFQGNAKTFAESQKRLKVLNKQEFAYTTDDNVDRKVEATKRTYRSKKIKVEPEVEKTVFNVPTIKLTQKFTIKENEHDGLQDSDSNLTDSNDSDSSGASVSRKGDKKNLQRFKKRKIGT